MRGVQTGSTVCAACPRTLSVVPHCHKTPTPVIMKKLWKKSKAKAGRVINKFRASSRPQSQIPHPDLAPPLVELPSATPIPPDADLGTRDAEADHPAEIAVSRDAAVPSSLSHVPTSPSIPAQLVESHLQSPIPPDPNPLPFLTESPEASPIPPVTDLSAGGAEADQPEEIVQDAVGPTSVPQMSETPSMPAQPASREESPALISPTPPAIRPPSPLINILEELSLAVQQLRAAVAQGESNLFQPLAAALNGSIMLGDNLKVCIHCPRGYASYGATGAVER